MIDIMKKFGLKKFGGKNDLDFDGVPNRKDCQPRNTMRQDKMSIKQMKDAAYGGVWHCHGYSLEPDSECPKCGRSIYDV